MCTLVAVGDAAAACKGATHNRRPTRSVRRPYNWPAGRGHRGEFHKQLGLSFNKIETVFADRFGLTVTRGALVRAVHRVAAKADPTYTALCETVKSSAMVVVDETGWRVHAELHWLWVFTTPDATVYAILPGRGCHTR